MIDKKIMYGLSYQLVQNNLEKQKKVAEDAEGLIILLVPSLNN